MVADASSKQVHQMQLKIVQEGFSQALVTSTGKPGPAMKSKEISDYFAPTIKITPGLSIELSLAISPEVQLFDVCLDIHISCTLQQRHNRTLERALLRIKGLKQKSCRKYCITTSNQAWYFSTVLDLQPWPCAFLRWCKLEVALSAMPHRQRILTCPPRSADLLQTTRP